MASTFVNGTGPRVAIVAEHASAKFGGEAILPLHYFRRLRARGIEAWLVVHDRTREELDEALAHERDRILYVPDLTLQKVLSDVGDRLPQRVALNTTGLVMHLATELAQREMVRALVERERIDVVHVPIPVSPRTPSAIFDVGAPVVFGPMNGGMNYPAAFSAHASAAESIFVKLGRAAADVINRLIPGKDQAAALLVANERTRAALPRTRCRNVIELVENGVDLSLFDRTEERPLAQQGRARFVFMGRLVTWKGVDMLLDALAAARVQADITLEILGDGDQRDALERQARRAGLAAHVSFRGFVTQSECADRLRAANGLVLPSLYECGGAVVLEAMAMALPVIANRWGGPADYLDSETGILVEPKSREHIVSAFAEGMVRLANAPAYAQQLGRAAREKVRDLYDWERKIDRILQVYEEVMPELERTSIRAPRPAPAVLH